MKYIQLQKGINKLKNVVAVPTSWKFHNWLCKQLQKGEAQKFGCPLKAS
jgi:hypothetical protein